MGSNIAQPFEGDEPMEIDESLFAEDEDNTEQASSPPVDEQPAPQPEESDIPDKYRGKSAMELIRMNEDAQKLIGKHGNEVGELRKIVDDILVSKQQESAQAPESPGVDFFDDPQGAVRNTLNNDPELQQLKQDVAAGKKERAAQQLMSRHPDYMQIAQSEEFGQWVAKSEVRLQMFRESNTNFNTALASELLDLYKESRAYKAETEQSAKNNKGREVKRAATGSGKASGESRGKPILSREALVELRRTDPQKYNRMVVQFREAYAEGRVR